MGYRFFACDLMPDEDGLHPVRAVLPLGAPSFSLEANARGIFTASADMRHGNVTPANLETRSTILVVEKDGQPVWAGPLCIATPDFVEQRVGLTAYGPLWLFEGSGDIGRFIRHDLDLSATGQADILRGLVEYAQDVDLHGVDADYGIQVREGAAGTVRDRSWLGIEHKNIGEAMRDLTNVEGGPDFRFDFTWSADRRLRIEFIAADAIGLPQPYVLRLGKQLLDFSAELDADLVARRVIVTGSQVGEDFIETTVSTGAVAGYPLREALDSHPTVQEVDTLEAWGQEFLRTHRSTVVIPTVTTTGGREPMVGYLIPGDSVQLQEDGGWLGTTALRRVRITSIEVKLEGDDDSADGDGVELGEEISLDLMEELVL